MTNTITRISLFLAFFLAAFAVHAKTFRTTVTSEIDINKPIEEVFDYATTASNWKIWHPNTYATEGADDHSATENEEIVETIKVGLLVGPKLYWTVAEHIVPNKWRILGHDQAGFIHVDLTYTLSMNEDGSTHFRRDMIWDLQKNPLSSAFNALAFKGYNKGVSAKALRRLKAAVEAKKD